MTDTHPFLLTLGEPAGIGPDCVLLAYQDHPQTFNNIIIVAKICWLKQRAAELQLTTPIHRCAEDFQRCDAAQGLWVYDPTSDAEREVVAGKPHIQEAEAVLACIRFAAEKSLNKQALGMITAPIEKAILRDAGFDFPGHTEFLADIAGVERVVMMLASSAVRVALLTTHVALKDVAALMDEDETVALIRTTYQAMQQQMGIHQPRLALCGLNPHAGEQGHFGREEIDILQPALLRLQAEGIVVDGPMPADTLFSAPMRPHYDAMICCYHDQGLIPLKALSFGDSVNVTLGLPFIRTSVDHGTALDRAGCGNISYTSLMAAITMAKQHRRSML